MDISRRTAECASLELESKKVDAASAKLVFSATNTCVNGQNSRHHVRLVFEQKWKLDEVEIVMQAAASGWQQKFAGPEVE